MTARYDFNDRVALVTGGGRGIGRAIALGLAECGAKLVLAARTKEELDKVVSEIKGNGGEATPVVTDLMFSEQIDALIEATMETYGRVDILINNAARSFLRPLMDLREDGWDKIFDVNCKAVFLLSRAVAKIMGEQGGGRIINITTVGAVRGGAGMGVYHASKAAVRGLLKDMAVKLAPHGIRVNAVSPGAFRTDMMVPVERDARRFEHLLDRIPQRRIGDEDDIKGVVVFLASDAAAFVTGTTVVADGGMLAL